MPTRNVNLTTELDAFVSERIENGRYEIASEAVRAALRVLEREYEVKLNALRFAQRCMRARQLEYSRAIPFSMCGSVASSALQGDFAMQDVPFSRAALKDLAEMDAYSLRTWGRAARRRLSALACHVARSFTS